MNRFLPVVLASSSLLVAACSPGSRNVDCRPLDQSKSTALRSAMSASPFRGTVFTLVMENHGASDIFGNKDAPYINSLANQYAVAAGYTDTFVHPSEPNYLWMVAGENFGVQSDGSPSSNHQGARSHIADQLEMAGLTWHSYQESMGAPCTLEGNGLYEPKHDPFVYFDDINGWDGSNFTRPARCTSNVVDYSQFDADRAAGTLPRYAFITPNMQNDMHDGTVKMGDDWLSREVPKILATKEFQNGGVLFLMWDEGSNSGDDPPMIVISPLAKKGFISHTAYTTSSYLKTVQSIMGMEPLPCDPQPDTVPTMDDLFTVPLPGK